jgi:hypothetical protein
MGRKQVNVVKIRSVDGKVPVTDPLGKDREFRSLDFMGYPRYMVDSHGGVYKYSKSMRHWRELKHLKARGDYHSVQLYRDGKAKDFMVHRLVLLAFVGPCPEGMEARHFPDGDKSNNRVGNLSWGTRVENMADKIVQGTSRCGKAAPWSAGVNHHKAKMTDDDVLLLRKLHREAPRGTRVKIHKRFARKFGLKFDAVYKAATYQTWRRLP